MQKETKTGENHLMDGLSAAPCVLIWPPCWRTEVAEDDVCTAVRGFLKEPELRIEDGEEVKVGEVRMRDRECREVV